MLPEVSCGRLGNASASVAGDASLSRGDAGASGAARTRPAKLKVARAFRIKVLDYHGQLELFVSSRGALVDIGQYSGSVVHHAPGQSGI